MNKILKDYSFLSRIINFYRLILPIVILTGFGTIPIKSQLLPWTVVDIMGNAYGMMSNVSKPLSFDPTANALTLIHRGHPSYSTTANIWYNVSTNLGFTWIRSGPIEPFGFRYPGRFPTCALHNPLMSGNPGDLMLTFVFPILLSGEFVIAYGYVSLGSGYGMTGIDTVEYAYSAHLWSAGNWVMWAYRQSSPAPYPFCFSRTQDYSVIYKSCDTSNFIHKGLGIGGNYRYGVNYFAAWNVWPGDDSMDYNVGYIKSTDNGASWSSWIRPQPGWRFVTGVPPGYFWWYFGGAGTYSFDMLVDANNKVHFFGVAEDTLTLERGIIEIYESTTGWDSKIITTNLNENTILSYETLNQMGNNLKSVISTDGNIMALYWLDAGNVKFDSLTDIWFSWRHINGNWATPVNLTQTPNYAEMLLHVATVMKFNGGNSYTSFLARCYEYDITTWPPNPTSTSNIFFTTHTFDAVVSVSDEQIIPNEFILSQNYPNPFNPKTNIKYQLHTNSYVSLKVYDLLGNEVAVLINEKQEAGNKSVEFDESRLPSGIYFYRINIINKNSHFMDVKKMALIK